MESNYQLTETEISLLVSTGFSERRIRSGELTHVELEDLEIIRYTMQCMDRLYPDVSVRYVEMNVGARGGAGYSFVAYDESQGPDQPFTIFTETGGTPENPVFTCSDTLFGQLLQPELESLVAGILAETGLNLNQVSASFPYQVDEHFDRTRTVARLLEDGECPPCSVRVEIRTGSMDQAAFDEAVKKIEALLRGRGLTGSVLVLGYAVDGDDPVPQSWNSVKFRAQILL